MPPCLAITEPHARTFAPPPGGTAAALEASLFALVTACEPYRPGSVVANDFDAAIRGRGQDALAAGGVAALAYLMRRVLDAAPGRYAARTEILERAWQGLPGWL